MTLQLNRNIAPIRMRNYGRIVQDMIGYAATMAQGPERDSLELYIAQCMRQRNLVWNRDQEAGISRVKEDMQCDSPAFEQLLAQNNGPTMGKKKKK